MYEYFGNVFVVEEDDLPPYDPAAEQRKSEIFEIIDANRDGVISRDEFLDLVAGALVAPKPAGNDFGPSLYEMINGSAAQGTTHYAGAVAPNGLAPQLSAPAANYQMMASQGQPGVAFGAAQPIQQAFVAQPPPVSQALVTAPAPQPVLAPVPQVASAPMIPQPSILSVHQHAVAPAWSMACPPPPTVPAAVPAMWQQSTGCAAPPVSIQTQPPATPVPSAPLAADAFDVLDRNHDGVVTREEFDSVYQPSDRVKWFQATKAAKESFSSPQDSDGVVSVEEFVSMYPPEDRERARAAAMAVIQSPNAQPPAQPPGTRPFLAVPASQPPVTTMLPSTVATMQSMPPSHTVAPPTTTMGQPAQSFASVNVPPPQMAPQQMPQANPFATWLPPQTAQQPIQQPDPFATQQVQTSVMAQSPNPFASAPAMQLATQSYAAPLTVPQTSPPSGVTNDWFDTIDKNHDGSITKDEFIKFMQEGVR